MSLLAKLLDMMRGRPKPDSQSAFAAMRDALKPEKARPTPPQPTSAFKIERRTGRAGSHDRAF